MFGKIGNSLKSFNWGNFLNNANKTINVVNQTIPLVRQAGPMFNNIRSMLRLAKAFGSETASNNFKNKNNNQQKNNINNNYNLNISDNDNFVQKKEVSNNNYPNFFI